jgi:hypothetical protein
MVGSGESWREGDEERGRRKGKERRVRGNIAHQLGPTQGVLSDNNKNAFIQHETC